MTGIPNNQVRHRNKIEQHEHCDVADARRTKLVDELGNPINDSNPLAVNATITAETGAKVPFIFNVPMPVAGTEYFFNLPLNTSRYKIQSRMPQATSRLAFTAGDTMINFMTIRAGSSEYDDNLKAANKTLYFQSNLDNNTMEIRVWIL